MKKQLPKEQEQSDSGTESGDLNVTIDEFGRVVLSVPLDELRGRMDNPQQAESIGSDSK